MSSLILINPWIYDFAAYDLWSKPLGLLHVASRLRRMGFGVRLIDCLDVHHPAMTAEKAGRPPLRRAYGTGKYWRKRVPPPAPLEGMRRPY
ncbi:MAG: radical SAM protein, partial [Deltaproteobacteria bacterium]